MAPIPVFGDLHAPRKANASAQRCYSRAGREQGQCARHRHGRLRRRRV